jgi:hypothetical protein
MARAACMHVLSLVVVLLLLGGALATAITTPAETDAAEVCCESFDFDADAASTSATIKPRRCF